MPATTYSVSVNEETARQFEATAAQEGLEPSEVLCRLVRQFVKAGGFDNEDSTRLDDSSSLEQQANEWLTLRNAQSRQHSEDAQIAATEPDGGTVKQRTRLPWEDPSDTVPPWQEPPSPKLPWED